MTTTDAAAGPAASAGDDDAQRRILNRLKRARGQLNAVIDAVESGADCRTVVTRLSAVSSALDKAGFAIVATAMRDCVDDDRPGAESAAPGDRLTIDELEKLFLTLS
ncbi:metal-sensitive transcriptional regulator [Agromyces sp. NPDC058110]|uniref:metal-sensitive transcriptional regulator n=1 Tax=Agromyces sp. NPDC058110 TaxID=3346345 RepID=UPI0036DFA3BE